MAAYERINCPQFVDFTSGEAFDIHDGADFCFEKGVVGEDGINLGFVQSLADEEAKIKELNQVLTNALNINKNYANQESHNAKKSIAQISNETKELVKQQQLNDPDNKENIVGTTLPKVGSALDMINLKSADTNQQQASSTCTTALTISNQILKEKNATTNSNTGDKHQRTLSTNSASKNTSEKPAMTLYKGIRFLPKQLSSFSNGSNDSQLATPSNKEKAESRIEKESYAAKTSSTATTSIALDKSHHKPKIVNTKPASIHLNTSTSANDAKQKMAYLTRSTPGKSASFKQQSTNESTTTKSKSQTIIANLKSNFMKSTKSTSIGSAANTSKLNSYASDKELNASSSKNTSKASSGGGVLSGFHLRKKSENNRPFNTSANSATGLLHTELRALKRSEFEKEKQQQQPQACIIKHDAEQRKQKEEVNRMRSKSQFRAEPIKKYKPLEIRPSEKPLTQPKSPKLNHHHHHNTSATTSHFHNLSHSHAAKSNAKMNLSASHQNH